MQYRNVTYPLFVFYFKYVYFALYIYYHIIILKLLDRFNCDEITLKILYKIKIAIDE